MRALHELYAAKIQHHPLATQLLLQGGAEGLKERGCPGAQEKSIACWVQQELEF